MIYYEYTINTKRVDNVYCLSDQNVELATRSIEAFSTLMELNAKKHQLFKAMSNGGSNQKVKCKGNTIIKPVFGKMFTKATNIFRKKQIDKYDAEWKQSPYRLASGMIQKYARVINDPDNEQPSLEMIKNQNRFVNYLRDQIDEELKRINIIWLNNSNHPERVGSIRKYYRDFKGKKIETGIEHIEQQLNKLMIDFVDLDNPNRNTSVDLDNLLPTADSKQQPISL